MLFHLQLTSYYLYVMLLLLCFSVFFFKQKTAYEMRISDWSSDVCSSDLIPCSSLLPRGVPRFFDERQVRFDQRRLSISSASRRLWLVTKISTSESRRPMSRKRLRTSRTEADGLARTHCQNLVDRERVGWGKYVAVRVSHE